MTTFPRRLVTAQDYDAAPPHTVVEFDRYPGALGYLNWDHRWEVSDDPRPADYAGSAIAGISWSQSPYFANSTDSMQVKG